MPISKHRRKHAQHHHRAQPKSSHAAQAPAKTAPKRSAITMMVILLAIFGAGIGFLSAGAEITWITGGALIGAIAGYFTGQGMDKVTAKAK